MKNTIICLCAITTISLSSYAQEISGDSLQKKQETKESEAAFKENILLFIAEHTRSENYYKIYPTENIWTLIKLDTRTGQMWQVQYSTEFDEDRFQIILNSTDLTNGSNTKAGRFELCPTKNIYNFILLDTLTGKMWQAQWSMKEDARGIVSQIYNN